MKLPDILHRFLPTLVLWTCLMPVVMNGQTPLCDSLTKALEQTAEDTNRVILMRELAASLVNTEPEKAIAYAYEFRKLSDKLNFPKGIALSYDVEGNALRLKGDYTGALEKHFRSLRILDSTKYTNGIRNISSNIGLDYFYLKNYDQALIYFTRSLKLTDSSDHAQLIKIYTNLGTLYSFTGQPRKAIEFFEKALPFLDADPTQKTHGNVYAGIGTAYARLEHLEQSLPYLQQALYCEERIGNKAAYAGHACTIGGIYIELRKFDKAHFYLNQAYTIATEINATSTLVFYYRNIAHLYFREGNFAKAYDNLAKFEELNDSLISKEHIAQMAEMESRYQVDAKNRELELLGKEKSLNESELKRAQLWRFTLVAMLGLVVGLLLLTYRNMQLKKKTNRLLQLENKLAADAQKDLERQNTRLQHETILAQYETLKSQVNPHFLFNSLNALSSLIKTDTEKAQQFTTVFSRLYRSVLELKDCTVITLADELQLADDYVYLQKIRFGESLHVDKRIQATQMNLYLPPFCLQMLIENAIKHNIVSAEQPLRISIYSGDGVIIISNNIQRRVVRDESTGTGIRNIIERFSILSDRIPEFTIANEQYIAIVPFITELL